MPNSIVELTGALTPSEQPIALLSWDVQYFPATMELFWWSWMILKCASRVGCCLLGLCHMPLLHMFSFVCVPLISYRCDMFLSSCISSSRDMSIFHGGAGVGTDGSRIRLVLFLWMLLVVRWLQVNNVASAGRETLAPFAIRSSVRYSRFQLWQVGEVVVSTVGVAPGEKCWCLQCNTSAKILAQFTL